MQPDWDYVKKTTLWHYEDLLKKLNYVTAYPVIWRAYNHDMAQAAAYARRLFPDNNIAAAEYPALIIDTMGAWQTPVSATGVICWHGLPPGRAVRHSLGRPPLNSRNSLMCSITCCAGHCLFKLHHANCLTTIIHRKCPAMKS